MVLRGLLVTSMLSTAGSLAAQTFLPPPTTVRCAKLGDAAVGLDRDAFTFQGLAGEAIELRLEPNSAGPPPTGGLVSFVLVRTPAPSERPTPRTRRSRGRALAESTKLLSPADLGGRGPIARGRRLLPTAIQAVLPSSGTYWLVVQELSGLDPFVGNYCVNLQSLRADSLADTAFVEELPPVTSLYVNPGDSRLLTARTAEGHLVDFYSTKDSEGFATQLIGATVESPDGKRVYLRIDPSGRISRVADANLALQLDWISDNEMLLSVVLPDGTRSSAHSLVLEEDARRSVVTDATTEANPTAPDQFFPAATDSTVTIRATKCDPPADLTEANVYLDVADLTSGTSGLHRPIIVPEISPGSYQTDIANSVATNGEIVQDLCDAGLDLLGGVSCALLKQNTFHVMVSCTTAAAPYLLADAPAVCAVLVGALTISCLLIEKFARGDISEGICADIDPATIDAHVPGEVMLVASIDSAPGFPASRFPTVQSAIFPSTGPFSPFDFHLVWPEPAVIRLDALPSGPIKRGETVNLAWEVGGGVDTGLLVLTSDNDPGVQDLRVEFDDTGLGGFFVQPATTTTYTLVAEGACGTDSRDIIVDVVELEAVDDMASTLPNEQVAIDVLANDKGLDVSLIGFAQGSLGTVADSGGLLVYTAGATPGTDSFDYTISDGVSSDTATVTVDVLGDVTGEFEGQFVVVGGSQLDQDGYITTFQETWELSGSVRLFEGVGFLRFRGSTNFCLTKFETPDGLVTIYDPDDPANCQFTPLTGFDLFADGPVFQDETQGGNFIIRVDGMTTEDAVTGTLEFEVTGVGREGTYEHAFVLYRIQ